MNIFKKISQMSLSAFAMALLTFAIYTATLFTALNSNAEVAVSPSSYVTTGSGVKIVKGHPGYVDGKKVEYQTSHSIPIKPAIKTRNGSEVRVPEKLMCNSKEGKCGKKLMAD